jgi:hypothetical protein
MTEKNYKKIIDDFLILNYKFLLGCATNILKNKKTDPNDLFGELTIYLYTHQTKLEDYIQIKMLQAFCVSWLSTQGRFNNTPFNIKYQSYSNETEIPEIADTKLDDALEDPYITDLRTSYTEDQVDKILYIHNQYDSLSSVHKILFDAHFLQNLSYEKIKNKYDFFREKNGKKVFYKSKKSIYNLMLELKQEIKKNYKDGDNSN